MLRTIRNHLKWFYQRRTRGFDDRELWDLDFSLIRLASASSRRVHRPPHDGVPMCFWEKSDGYDGSGYANLDQASRRWEGVLTEMRAGLHAAIDPLDTEALIALPFEEFRKRSDANEAKIQRAFDLLAKYHGCLWD